jgi:hypothetical protein
MRHSKDLDVRHGGGQFSLELRLSIKVQRRDVIGHMTISTRASNDIKIERLTRWTAPPERRICCIRIGWRYRSRDPLSEIAGQVSIAAGVVVPKINLILDRGIEIFVGHLIGHTPDQPIQLPERSLVTRVRGVKVELVQVERQEQGS